MTANTCHLSMMLRGCGKTEVAHVLRQARIPVHAESQLSRWRRLPGTSSIANGRPGAYMTAGGRSPISRAEASGAGCRDS